jgi:hypothetical protein
MEPGFGPLDQRLLLTGIIPNGAQFRPPHSSGNIDAQVRRSSPGARPVEGRSLFAPKPIAVAAAQPRAFGTPAAGRRAEVAHLHAP